MGHGVGNRTLGMVAILLAAMIGGSLSDAVPASATGVTLNGIGSDLARLQWSPG